MFQEEARISFLKKLLGLLASPQSGAERSGLSRVTSGPGHQKAPADAQEPSGPSKVIPVNSVVSEYAYIQSHRCQCGGVWEKLGRVSDYAELPLFITDHFRLKCQACGRLEQLAFRVNVRSPEYEGRGSM